MESHYPCTPPASASCVKGSHWPARLGAGALRGTIVRCPTHSWRYDVCPGQTIHELGDGVARFLVQVVDGTILVTLGERRCTVMEDGLGSANTRRAMSRRVERVERGVPAQDET